MSAPDAQAAPGPALRLVKGGLADGESRAAYRDRCLELVISEDRECATRLLDHCLEVQARRDSMMVVSG